MTWTSAISPSGQVVGLGGLIASAGDPALTLGILLILVLLRFILVGDRSSTLSFYHHDPGSSAQ